MKQITHINYRVSNDGENYSKIYVYKTAATASKSNPRNQKEGATVGNILNCDIMAFINGNAIPSWNADKKTLVFAEELANYGFDVIWNENDQTLKITYNPNKKVSPIQTDKNAKQSGSIYCKYIASNIKTYIAGKEVQAYNISAGKTLVNIEDLAVYSVVTWNENDRQIKLVVK